MCIHDAVDYCLISVALRQKQAVCFVKYFANTFLKQTACLWLFSCY
ncbi:hypothetical protein appser10_9470 [Actinobacillus pleuropneumoniae serovar 10 str. D13039]|nr:hypothetical protein appser10_9470 [Actinobacillus pleuropneumoniae serovar 10 str. D13039]